MTEKQSHLDQSYPKCWCGNIARKGQQFCGSHMPDEEPPELLTRDDWLELVAAHRAEIEARVAAARREGIEAALVAVDAEPEPEGEMPAKLANTDKRILVLATVRATKRGIDGRIRALLEASHD